MFYQNKRLRDDSLADGFKSSEQCVLNKCTSTSALSRQALMTTTKLAFPGSGLPPA